MRFQRYVVQKLDMDFKISMIHEQRKNLEFKLNSILSCYIQTFGTNNEIKEKNELDYMNLFPIEKSEELDELEELLRDNKINHKNIGMYIKKNKFFK